MVLNLTALLCKLLGSKKLILSDILSRPSISVVAGSGAATVARVSYWRYLSLVGADMMMMFDIERNGDGEYNTRALVEALTSNT